MIRRTWWRRRRPIDCREVGRVLQSYLDDDLEPEFAANIAAHLEACRSCGLDADTYRQIKRSLASRLPALDPAAIERLRAFGERLTEPDP
ncbi:MAG: zf-HC2 domain-containing protein [Acidimicrobiales bacterium]